MDVSGVCTYLPMYRCTMKHETPCNRPMKSVSLKLPDNIHVTCNFSDATPCEHQHAAPLSVYISQDKKGRKNHLCPETDSSCKMEGLQTAYARVEENPNRHLCFCQMNRNLSTEVSCIEEKCLLVMLWVDGGHWHVLQQNTVLTNLLCCCETLLSLVTTSAGYAEGQAIFCFVLCSGQ